MYINEPVNVYLCHVHDLKCKVLYNTIQYTLTVTICKPYNTNDHPYIIVRHTGCQLPQNFIFSQTSALSDFPIKSVELFNFGG